MEKRVDSIVFSRLSYNDFDKINKKGSPYRKGGGQSYIDFSTSNVSINDWNSFLGPKTGDTNNGPKWEFKVNSLGLNIHQNIEISQRRKTSISVRDQKLPEHSKKGNRIYSWHPNNSFPIDYNPEVNNLIVYIIKSTDGDFWAGWFLTDNSSDNRLVNVELDVLLQNKAGIYSPTKELLFNTKDNNWLFYSDAISIKNQIKTDEDIDEDLLNQDTSSNLADIIDQKGNEKVKEVILKIRKRNNKIVKELKKLYDGKCQITGEELTFKKKDGTFYSEVHHLIPLGESGSDSYANAIVISPLIHRMLHYAQVSEIDLSKIENNKLTIKINEKDYEIEWHPDHIRTIEESLAD